MGPRPVVEAFEGAVASAGLQISDGVGALSAIGTVSFQQENGTDEGSTGALKLNSPIVGAAVTESGHGYDLFASDGGVFNFGDATFHGSEGARKLNQPVLGGARSPG